MQNNQGKREMSVRCLGATEPTRCALHERPTGFPRVKLINELGISIVVMNVMIGQHECNCTTSDAVMTSLW